MIEPGFYFLFLLLETPAVLLAFSVLYAQVLLLERIEGLYGMLGIRTRLAVYNAITTQCTIIQTLNLGYLHEKQAMCT